MNATTANPALTLTTPRQSGAVALLQLHGPGARSLLEQLTGRDNWPHGRVHLVDLAGIDHALAVALGDDWAQVMPHGGPRVVQRVIERLIELGARYEAEPDARALYPEASSAIEADMLATIAQAASPAAIDLLAQQPTRWQRELPPGDREVVRQRSAVLDRLIWPPSVVVVGRPNVGKSTLTNLLLGKRVSVVADLPGTTRDWVGAVAELAGDWRADDADSTAASALHRCAVAVNWLDTPGLRGEAQRGERRAIELARHVIETADVVVAMRDPHTDWPASADLPREPDVWVVNKVDPPSTPGERGLGGLGDGTSASAALPISAQHDRQIDALAQRVLSALELDALDSSERWAFSPTLRRYVAGERVDVKAYLGAQT